MFCVYSVYPMHIPSPSSVIHKLITQMISKVNVLDKGGHHLNKEIKVGILPKLFVDPPLPPKVWIQKWIPIARDPSLEFYLDTNKINT